MKAVPFSEVSSYINNHVDQIMQTAHRSSVHEHFR
uniref:Uncharacterized protein n=1 Tax=Arundo donax TaxID=35708 RepID=A0A0A9AVA8_ARUDO